MSATSLTQPAPVTLLLVDDHPIVRAGLRVVEQIAPDIRVVGEASSVETGWEAVQSVLPNVVLLDLRLPDGDGLELCRRIRDRYPNTRVLCLTSYADARQVLAAMEAGVDGYLLKQNDAVCIAEAVRMVMAGVPVFDPALEAVSLSRSKTAANQSNPLDALSTGELRVLAHVAQGRTDKEAAAALGLSVKTVRNCLDRAFAKLGVHTRTQAAMAFAANPLPAHAAGGWDGRE